MKINEVLAEVERIAGLIDDPEAHHGAEDALYEKVLRAIADSNASFYPRALARAALQTKKHRPAWRACS